MNAGRAFLLLLVLVVPSYLPAVTAGFIWDDDLYVTANAALRSVEGLGRIWTDPTAMPQYYPLVHSSFWIEYHLWKLHPLGFHLVNVLLHTLNAWLVWQVLRVLKVPGALFAAALFAVHPVQVESVAWITERKNVLSTTFYLASLLACLRDRYALGLVCFVCALLSKTVACSLPAAILLLQWWQRGRLEKRDLVSTAPMFAIGAAFAIATATLERFHAGAAGDEWNYSFIQRGLIAGRAVWFYARTLVWPSTLTFIYPQWVIQPHVWWQWLYPVAAFALLAAAWAFRTRLGRGPLAALLFFGGTLVPALGFVNIYPMRYSFVADHFQYVASIGLLTLVAAAATMLIDRMTPSAQGLGRSLCVALILVLAVLTFRQARLYASGNTIWEDTLRKNPDSWMAHGNLAALLATEGRPAEAAPHYQIAIDHFAEAVRRRPQSAGARRNFALALHAQGKADAANQEFAAAVKLDPDDYVSRNQLGLGLSEKGRSDEALVQLREAVRANPRFAAAHFNLANVLFRLGRLDEAEAQYRAALNLKPFDVEATSNLGVLLLQTGRTEDARNYFLRAISLAPDNIRLYQNLAVIWQSEGRYQEALDVFREIVRLNPDDSAARQKVADLEKAMMIRR